ncbi:MAG: universal stress protein [Proteobacteria bacterium]|nr:universal stress protein [Pseudomonadota bacterium]MBU1584925.1 universal stress protein [Pseudomonadota bacterium]MBU2453781.1 universal stress protein [Pseudomonadota bacterium]
MSTQLKYRNILLCTDYSKDAEASFVHAFDQANKYGATLHIFNVIPAVNPCGVQIFETPLSKKEALKKSEEMDEENRLQALGALKKVYIKRCRDIIDHKFAVRVGSPDVEIIKYTEENHVDMIIMGTAGRHETKRLTYIRTAANVSKFAACQVITIGSPKQ